MLLAYMHTTQVLDNVQSSTTISTLSLLRTGLKLIVKQLRFVVAMTLYQFSTLQLGMRDLITEHA